MTRSADVLETPGYDVIGDVHGCADTLEELLHRMGYRRRSTSYRHPTRTAIFVGDLIDRGPKQRAVVDIVRAMVEGGVAECIMGNHELNAIAYATKRIDGGGYLREHSAKYQHHHQAFLDAYPREDERGRVLDWFRTLPLWLDLGQLRVIHATWHDETMDRLRRTYGAPRLSEELLMDAFARETWAFEAKELLLQGRQVPVDEAELVPDRFGIPRHSVRVRWWGEPPTDLRDAHHGPSASKPHVRRAPFGLAHWAPYAADAPPVLFGHYWLDGEPGIQAPNVACLDYSVAAPRGALVAYRWSGEQVLSDRHFVVVPKRET